MPPADPPLKIMRGIYASPWPRIKNGPGVYNAHLEVCRSAGTDIEICRPAKLCICSDRSRTAGSLFVARGLSPRLAVRHGARFFTFVAGKNEADEIGELDLPAEARVIFVYRNEQLHFVDDKTDLKKGDEVVVLTLTDNLKELQKCWEPKQTDEDD